MMWPSKSHIPFSCINQMRVPLNDNDILNPTGFHHFRKIYPLSVSTEFWLNMQIWLDIRKRLFEGHAFCCSDSEFTKMIYSICKSAYRNEYIYQIRAISIDSIHTQKQNQNKMKKLWTFDLSPHRRAPRSCLGNYNQISLYKWSKSSEWRWYLNLNCVLRDINISFFAAFIL